MYKEAVTALSPNQTTLVLALELHHKFGSAEVVWLTHQHGLAARYDEMLRFRKTATKCRVDHANDVLQQFNGVERWVQQPVGLITTILLRALPMVGERPTAWP